MAPAVVEFVSTEFSDSVLSDVRCRISTDIFFFFRRARARSSRRDFVPNLRECRASTDPMGESRARPRADSTRLFLSP